MTRTTRQRLYLWGFITPCLIYIVAWRILPLSYTFIISFFRYDILKGSEGFIGLQNYVEVLTSDRFLHSLRVSIIFTVGATLLEFLVGLLMAVLLSRELKGRDIFKVVLLFPMFIANVAVGTVWYIMYHEQVGPLSYLLRTLGLGSFSWFNSPLWAMVALVISDVWQWTPFVFILLFAGLETIDPQLYEAAEIDGASPFQQFRHVSLPLISGTILVTLVLRSMDAFRAFGKIYVLTGGGPGRATEVITMLIYRVAFKWFKMDQAAALVVFLLLLLGGAYFFLVRRIRGSESDI